MQRTAVVAVVMTLLPALVVPRPIHAQSDADGLAEAKSAFQQGLRAYDAHDYAEALRSFERSYALSHRLELLFDIAETHAAMGECQKAVDDLDQLIGQAQQSSGLVDRANVRRGALLPCAPPKRQPAQEAPSPAPEEASPNGPSGVANISAPPAASLAVTPDPPNATRAGPRRRQTLLWGATGASAACAVTGLTLMWSARTSQHSVEAASTWDGAQIREDERGRTMSTVGVALLVAATVAAATGLVAYLLGRRSP